MLNTRQKEFVKELEAMNGSRFLLDTFSDAVGMMACAIEKGFSLKPAECEERYMAIVGKYTKAQAEHAANMLAIVVQGLSERRETFLGPVLEEIGAANTKNGQFLTPVSVSDLCSRITAGDIAAKHKAGDIVSVNDPACGASVMLISHGEALVAAGIPQRDIFIIGGDIDARACDIAFIELSLLGYAARIDHQDALTLKRYSRPRWTVGYYLHGTQWRENRGKREDGAEPQAVTIRGEKMERMEKTAKKEAKK